MLALFETPAGFALFKVLQEDKLNTVEVRSCIESAVLLHEIYCGLLHSYMTSVSGAVELTTPVSLDSQELWKEFQSPDAARKVGNTHSIDNY